MPSKKEAMADYRVEFTVKELFEQLNEKLNAVLTLISAKADRAELTVLENKVNDIEVNGTNHSRDAIRKVEELEDQIDKHRNQMYGAIAIALLSLAGNIATAIFLKGMGH